MKTVISFTIAFIVFICSIIGANHLIEFVASGIMDNTIRTRMVILLWVFLLPAIVGISAFIATVVGSIFRSLMG